MVYRVVHVNVLMVVLVVRIVIVMGRERVLTVGVEVVVVMVVMRVSGGRRIAVLFGDARGRGRRGDRGVGPHR